MLYNLLATAVWQKRIKIHPVYHANNIVKSPAITVTSKYARAPKNGRRACKNTIHKTATKTPIIALRHVRIMAITWPEVRRSTANQRPCRQHTINRNKYQAPKLCHNFIKCWPVFTILSSIYSAVNLQLYTLYSLKIPQHAPNASLHYLVKYS